LFGGHITPRLSTVDQQTIQMGKSALQLLVDLIEKKEINGHRQQKIVLEPLLIAGILHKETGACNSTDLVKIFFGAFV